MTHSSKSKIDKIEHPQVHYKIAYDSEAQSAEAPFAAPIRLP